MEWINYYKALEQERIARQLETQRVLWQSKVLREESRRLDEIMKDYYAQLQEQPESKSPFWPFWH